MSQISQNNSNSHDRDLKKIVDALSKITSLSSETIKPHLNELLSRLSQEQSFKAAGHFFDTTTDDEWITAFHEWSESHREKKLPVLNEEAMSRESFYDEW
ncbi:hypothetical protein [Myxosarcina sp. GI1]|uniref:hypothetical protein n=1 Tax=Myxosarcina sp. GI1 TaxID=1541065 RepID=UPI00055DD3A2|nr:hypothetical protein [Myxosarcina sp. GI1]